MSTTNLFEIASRKQYRYTTSKGNVCTEDLWELPLTVLDSSYREHNRVLRETEDESLLDMRNAKTTELTNKRDIIKYVVQTRQAETLAKKQAEDRKAQAARVRELMAQRQDDALKGKSDEELQALLKNLEAENG